MKKSGRIFKISMPLNKEDSAVLMMVASKIYIKRNKKYNVKIHNKTSQNCFFYNKNNHYSIQFVCLYTKKVL